jgi:carbon starvation protein
MNGAVLLVVSICVFVAAYLLYGRFLTRLFGVDPDRETPAHTRTDGVDYIPTKFPVLFGHHFASIAGAGPIVGPIAAAYFGWGAVALWILIGCVFVGAMHDFAALFVSVRADGRSIGHVIEKYIGYSGRQIFLLFSWAALILVVAVFAVLVAKTFVLSPAVATASLLFILMAPCFGYLVYRKNVSIMAASCVFVPLLFLFVWLGAKLPLNLVSILGVESAVAQNIWIGILFVYVFIASVIPVWILLQPRDYLNSFLLYAMVILAFVGMIFAAPHISGPPFNGFVVMKGGSGVPLFPILFITVACGACSGFHALVASGTTAKQLNSERDILPIGYGSMLVEGVLAIMALISVCYLVPERMGEVIKANGPVVAFAKGLAFFCTSIKLPAEIGENFFTLAISAFLLTTLDTATRLARFAWQELFLKKQEDESDVESMRGLFSNRFVATAIVLAGAGFLALMKSTGADGEPIDAWRVIWPVFGASNQLLAALTLLVISVVLKKQGKKAIIAIIPMIFMMLVCLIALCSLLESNWNAENRNWVLVIATGFLLVMAAVLMIQGVRSVKKAKYGEEAE